MILRVTYYVLVILFASFWGLVAKLEGPTLSIFIIKLVAIFLIFWSGLQLCKIFELV